MIKKLDNQLQSQPKDVFFCKKCIVSNQRPKIEFDEKGICSACNYAEYKNNEIDWVAREKELQELCDKHRSKDGSFDVIVPGSGGKDSGYTAHILKEKYGMHPLTVCWAPFMYTDIGWKNFNNYVNSGFTTFTCYQDGKLHRKLARTAFELKGDAWEPFTYGQKSLAFQMAVKFKIPLIFYGENGELEYSGFMKSAKKPSESVEDWNEMYFKGSGVDMLVEESMKAGILKSNEVESGELELYKPPNLEEVKKLGAEMHWLSYYHKWIPQENFYYAQKYTGFEVNEDGRSEGTYSKYASLDDKTDGFHFYLGFIKFGLGRATRDAMMEIRSGHITREEGVALVRRYDGEFPKKYFKEFLEYLDITEKHFWEIVDSYRSPHLWEKVDGEWKLKHEVE